MNARQLDRAVARGNSREEPSGGAIAYRDSVAEAVVDAVNPDAGRREARARAWRWVSAAIVLGALLIVAILRETAWSIVHTWVTSPTFIHGYLIAPISGFLIWLGHLFSMSGLGVVERSPDTFVKATNAHAFVVPCGARESECARDRES